MCASISPPAQEFGLALVGSNQLQVKDYTSNGVSKAYLLPLDHRLGNKEGVFDTGGVNFSRSARDISLVGNILHAKLSTSGGVWWDDQMAIDIEIPPTSSTNTSTTPSIKFRRCDFMRLKLCRNLRLIDSFFVAAECLQTDHTYKETYLDLNSILGRRNGAFDKHGANFSKTAKNVELVGATLYADLRCNDGTMQRASINLTNILQFKAGAVMPLRDIKQEDIDLEVLRDEGYGPTWLMNARNIRLLNYRQKRRWHLIADCFTPNGIHESLLTMSDIVGPHVDQMFCFPIYAGILIPEAARATQLQNGILTASFKDPHEGSEDWLQQSIDLRQIVSNEGGLLIIKRSGSNCYGCGGLFYADTLYTPSSGCRMGINISIVKSTRKGCALCKLIHGTIEAYAPKADSHEVWIEIAAASGLFSHTQKRAVELVIRGSGSKHKLQNLLGRNTKTPPTEIRCTILLELEGSSNESADNGKATEVPRQFRTLAQNTRDKCWLEPNRRWPLIQEWIKICSTEHTGCQSGVNPNPKLPSRYLDIGTSERDKIKVASSNGEYGTYACLSHCWGGKNACTLNVKTKAQFSKAIPLHVLPPVFANAVSVCRRLGLRRLWVDSLCIQQDSKEDWFRESQEMGKYYSNCTVCVAATSSSSSSISFNIADRPTVVRSAAVDLKSGPFNLLSYPTELTKKWPHFVHAYEWEILLKKFPLLSRAWVLQERLLSPRVLHFCGTEVVFECAEMVACECGEVKDDLIKSGLGVPMDLRTVVRGTTTSYGLAHRRQHLKDAQWDTIISTYSSLQLTRYTDRLIALSGLASTKYKGNEERTGNSQNGPSSVYLAGLWKETLHRDLAWFVGDTLLSLTAKHENFETTGSSVERKLKPSEYLAPSWSWASVLDPVRYLTEVDQTPLFQVIDTKIITATEDPFGSVKEGSYLHLSGKILKTSWALQSGLNGANSFILKDLVGSQQLDKEDVVGIVFSPDLAIEKSGADQVLQSVKLYVFPVATTKRIGYARWFASELIDVSKSTLCLVLKMVEGVEGRDKNVYQRVGFVEYANFCNGVRNIDTNKYVEQEFFVK